MDHFEKLAECVAGQIATFTKQGRYITRAMLVAENADLRRQLAELKVEMAKAQDLIGAAYGLLRRAREGEDADAH